MVKIMIKNKKILIKFQTSYRWFICANVISRLVLVAPTGSGKFHFIITNTVELLKTFDKIEFIVSLLPLQAEFDLYVVKETWEFGNSF